MLFSLTGGAGVATVSPMIAMKTARCFIFACTLNEGETRSNHAYMNYVAYIGPWIVLSINFMTWLTCLHMNMLFPCNDESMISFCIGWIKHAQKNVAFKKSWTKILGYKSISMIYLSKCSANILGGPRQDECKRHNGKSILRTLLKYQNWKSTCSMLTIIQIYASYCILLP